MKKALLLLLFFSAAANSQIINIPDANFKARLIAVGVDTNSDGNIQLSEAQARTSLNIPEGGITSFSGIENFTNLTYLNCSNHRATSLNVSALVNLTYLDCSYNYYLAYLTLGNHPNLSYLDCAHNSLQVVNVGSLTSLTQLKVWGNNISVLDVGALVNLTYLDCAENLNISVLDVSNLTNLTYLSCVSNTISELDVTNLTNLTTLYCNGNNISVLDVGQLVHLNRLFCYSNQITSLDLHALTQLDILFCQNNPMPTIDLSTLTALTRLSCGSPQLTALDISHNTNLQSLSINGGQFTSINLSPLTHLTGLDLWNSALTAIDISSLPLLYQFRLVSPTNLRYLNLKNGGNLSYLSLSNSSNITNVCCNASDLANVTGQLSLTNTASICTISSECLFFPMGNYNTITGKVHFDSNNNGCDSSDFQQPNVKMKISSGSNVGYTYTNADGDYYFFSQAGNFAVTPVVENLPFFSFTPSPATVSFANNNGNTATRDFCSTINGTHIDVEVLIVPIVPARPGFDSTYKIVYRNKGNQRVSGTIELAYQDAILDYVSSTMALDSQSTGVLNWSYTDLLPFETRDFIVVMNLNSPVETPAVTIGEQLDFSAQINPVSVDEFAYDNTFGLKQIVIGSFDPNDKACLEGSLVSTTKIGDYLHYNINFENIGTASAEKVLVKDIIDTTKFDLSTLMVLDASHPMLTRVEGNLVQFVFENIGLGSHEHGNVTFKIKTKTTLTTGTTVSNKANIFFDYNAPIETNLASTTFQNLGVDTNHIDASIKLFPNPAVRNVTIKSDAVIEKIELFDVNGRILEVRFSNESRLVLDVSAYSKGIYFVKVTSAKGSKAERFIKE